MVNCLVKGSSDLNLASWETATAINLEFLLVLLMSKVRWVDLNDEYIILIFHLTTVSRFEFDLSFILNFSVVVLASNFFE